MRGLRLRAIASAVLDQDLAIGEKCQQEGVLLLDRRGEHHHGAPIMRHQCKAAAGRLHLSKIGKGGTQPADLDAQPRPVGFIGMAGAEGAGKQDRTNDIRWCSLGERAGERKQHRAACERHDLAAHAHHVAAGIDDERIEASSASTS